MVILDEPSSALDPISEYQVNQSMLEAARDKTMLFISHRLSTTKIADRIVMLEEGRIIEWGSHEELMALGGKYAQMFHMQAEKYQDSGEWKPLHWVYINEVILVAYFLYRQKMKL